MLLLIIIIVQKYYCESKKNSGWYNAEIIFRNMMFAENWLKFTKKNIWEQYTSVGKVGLRANKMPEGLFSHLLADDGLKWIYIA